MKKLIGSFLALIAAFSAVGTAHASLIEVDLFSSGDSLLTVDKITGLAWLDLTATVGLSYDEIMAGTGGWTTDQGFR